MREIKDMSYKELKEYLEHLKKNNKKQEELYVRKLMKSRIIEHKKKNKKVIYNNNTLSDLSFLNQIDLNHLSKSNNGNDNKTSSYHHLNARFKSEFDIMKCINSSGSTSFTKPYM